MISQNEFAPAHTFAVQFGVKMVAYGPPGGGKTPILANTAPRPVVVMSEPGFLSMRGSQVPTFPAFTPKRFDDFMEWAKGSNETKNYDTFVFDSMSQSAERKVDEELGGTSKAGNETHGQRAYGKMSRWVMEHLNTLYFMPQKHIILICKQQAFEVNGMIYYRPYFPGRELPVRVPHLFDLVTRLGTWNIPGVGEAKAFRTKEQFDQMGRDRSGRLLEYEPPDVAKLINKIMA